MKSIIYLIVIVISMQFMISCVDWWDRPYPPPYSRRYPDRVYRHEPPQRQIIINKRSNKPNNGR